VVVQDWPRDETIRGAKRDQEGTEINAQITIPLDIPEVRVLKAELNPRGDCPITVESTRAGTRCRKWGRESKDCHGGEEWITLRHLPILGRRVYLHRRPQRYRCPYCEGGPTTTQELSWYEAKSPPSKA
jgi:hypothetical protein